MTPTTVSVENALNTPTSQTLQSSTCRCRQTFTPAAPERFLLGRIKQHVVEWAALRTHQLVLFGDPAPPLGVITSERWDVASDGPHTRRNNSTDLGLNLLASLTKQVAHPLGWRRQLPRSDPCLLNPEDRELHPYEEGRHS